MFGDAAATCNHVVLPYGRTLETDLASQGRMTRPAWDQSAKLDRRPRLFRSLWRRRLRSQRPQPATHNFPQSAPSKFDFGFESANIPQRRGRDDKALDGILKTGERRLNKIHFPNQTIANGAQAPDLIRNFPSRGQI
jgi:hypothetical protein